ncbi:MAG: hypothetical protein LH472_05560 [Pyrinomonadaceae bacterium]|nr:hypothetical protein [Pyrinomonadaceae bacterium]
MKQADVLILGAGCAGTSLAHYLENLGCGERVVLLDSRTKFDREQRWCSWAKMPKSLAPLVSKSWQKWTVGDENYSIARTSDKFVYQQIYAPKFFEHFHTRWQKPDTLIELNLDEKVERIEEKSNYVEVTTSRETWRANLVFDARHQGSANLKNLEKSNNAYLHQTFLGWKVMFPRAVFDAETAALMDFRTAQNDGVNFIYVLPYSDREALVESTSFSQNPTNWGNHLSAVTKYIAENFGDDYDIIAEESGELPMTTAKLPTKSSERIYSIGIAGGNARPSSGYAFHRIQRQTSEIARAIVERRTIQSSFASNKYNFLDAVFLESVARNPNSAREFFMRMFANVEPDSLIRFLLDESSYRDDLAVIGALPKMRFGAASLQRLRREFSARKGKNEELQTSHGTLCDSVGEPFHRLAARRVGR